MKFLGDGKVFYAVIFMRILCLLNYHVKITHLAWATGDSLLVSRKLFQLRIYLPAGDYFTLLTEEYGKYMDGPG
ncbi:hypothetical protein AB6B54_00105, partial [Escherichia coli]